MQHDPSTRKSSLILALVLGLVGFGLALYELLSPGSGTTGTAGAILVTASTTLLAGGAAILAFVRLPGWFFALLLVLLVIDAAATALAAYFLMATLLMVAMIGAFLAGIVATVSGRARHEAAS